MFLENQNINIQLFCHCYCHLIHDPGSAYYDDFGGGFAPSEVIIKCRSRIKDQEAMAVAVKKFNKNDLSYTCTLILIPNHLTGGSHNSNSRLYLTKPSDEAAAPTTKR